MSTVTPIRRPGITPPAHPDVSLAGALLRCRRCQFQWQASLDEWSEVPADQARCPNCATRSPEPPQAA